MLSSPAATRRSITAGTGSCESRDRWMTSGGESACSLNSGYRCFTARNRSSYHVSGRSGLWPPCSSSWMPPTAMVSSILRKISSKPSTYPSLDPDRTIERAEVAPRDAHVRVVDVAVDDVGDDALGMLAGANGVGEPAEDVRGRVACTARARPRGSAAPLPSPCPAPAAVRSSQRSRNVRLLSVAHARQRPSNQRRGCIRSTTPTSAASVKNRSRPARSRVAEPEPDVLAQVARRPRQPCAGSSGKNRDATAIGVGLAQRAGGLQRLHRRRRPPRRADRSSTRRRTAGR